MDPFKVISLIPTILRLVSLLQTAVNTGLSFKTITALIQNPEVQEIFKQLGSQLFPLVKPELQPTAAVVATYSPAYVQWVQNAANRLLNPSPGLDVDGHYGPMTRTAVERLQKTYGLIVDGWAGDVTRATLQVALARLDAGTLAVPVAEVPKA